MASGHASATPQAMPQAEYQIFQNFQKFSPGRCPQATPQGSPQATPQAEYQIFQNFSEI
ncbi:hypothetical protein T4C_13593 [Trichinella pseudospiralis]|uniref:Uncharacterized protein n=1 Tax=Trichinella pseudospiralis TaxID=6337 RepID=A0A0V1ICG8_TRIPS|nr:hypothetical protein T4C_13593 [Trichinella pseudospiralis]